MTDHDRLGPDRDARSFRFDLASALEQVMSNPADPEQLTTTTSSPEPDADGPKHRRRRRWRR